VKVSAALPEMKNEFASAFAVQFYRWQKLEWVEQLLADITFLS
jgi:hypothetical protein